MHIRHCCKHGAKFVGMKIEMIAAMVGEDSTVIQTIRIKVNEVSLRRNI